MKLDSLFTDLDPLGTGKSKPYTDKKDFFAVKATPMMGSGGGAVSQESLSNVGFDDSLCDGFTNIMSHPGFNTNNVPSSNNIPCQVSQRRISENSLRVALPPEEGRMSVSPGDPGLNPHSSYGSILELEASPRRYRNSEMHELYSTSQDSPSCSSRYGDCKDSSIDSSLNIPMPAEPPPALPERPPKSISLSPPPLPPKKQNHMMSSFTTGSRREESSRDVYEYLSGVTPDYLPKSRTELSHVYEQRPDMNPPTREPEISINDLVKMNVIELSQKLTEGKLPRHLSGMSLFELVDYIGKQSREHAEPTPPQPTLTDSLQPNLHQPSIISGSNSKSNVASLSLCSSLETNQLPPPPPERSSADLHKASTYSLNSLSGLSSSQNLSSSAHSTSPKPMAASRLDVGFDDDFSHFNPGQQQQQRAPSEMGGGSIASECMEGGESESKAEVFDRYAVFRELQLEEELVNAWKSPTEESKTILGAEANFEAEVDPTVLEAEGDDDRVDVRDEEEAYFDTMDREEDCPEPLGSPPPVSHFSGDWTTTLGSCEGDEPAANIGEHEAVSQGEAVDAELANRVEQEDHSQADTEASVYESQIEDTPFTTPPANSQLQQHHHRNESLEWANFEDHSYSTKNYEFSSFLSKDEQDRILGKKSMFKPEFMRKDSYTKLTESQPNNDSQEEGDTRNKFSIQSPKTLRDLPSTASSLQARIQNFKRFDQPAANPQPAREPKASFKNQRLSQEDDDDDDENPFEGDWEPAFYSRKEKEEGEGGKLDSWDLSFQTETAGTRQRRLTGRLSNLEEAFPEDRGVTGSVDTTSHENLFSNPFNDNFVTMHHLHNNGRTASATPPVYEGDRISNTSDLSFQSGEILNSVDIFEGGAGFDDATFRVEAKTSKVTKSDSVNIFSTADDPFDDDFFK